MANNKQQSENYFPPTPKPIADPMQKFNENNSLNRDQNMIL